MGNSLLGSNAFVPNLKHDKTGSRGGAAYPGGCFCFFFGQAKKNENSLRWCRFFGQAKKVTKRLVQTKRNKLAELPTKQNISFYENALPGPVLRCSCLSEKDAAALAIRFAGVYSGNFCFNSLIRTGKKTEKFSYLFCP